MIEKAVIPLGGKKLNWDDNEFVIPLGDSRDRLDIVYPDGDLSVLESRKEVLPIGLKIRGTSTNFSFIPGTNTFLGSCKDIENNAIVLFYHNPAGHSILRMYTDNTIEKLSEGKTQWNFQLNYPVKGEIIGTGDQAFLLMNDNYNPVRNVNIKNLIDGLYSLLEDGNINLLKPAPITKPTIITAILNSKPNRIKDKLLQFAYNYIYQDGLESAISHHSDLVFNYSSEFINGVFVNKNSIDNTLVLSIPVSSIVKSINIYVRVTDIGTGSTSDVSGTGISGSWMWYDKVDNNSHSSLITYAFYNDKSGVYADQSKFLHLYDNIPFKAATLNVINGDRVLLGEPDWKYSNIVPNISLECVSVLKSPTTTVTISNGVAYSSGSLNTSTVDVRGVGTLLSYSFIITKLVAGVIVSKEVFHYEKMSSVVSGGYQNNSDVCTFFVDELKKGGYGSQSAKPIIPSVIGGGNPSKVQVKYLKYNEGQYQTAVVYNGFIYRSENNGNTWTKVATSQYWTSIAISSDGKFQTATIGATNAGSIQKSVDYGKTWVLAHSSLSKWTSVAMSFDGKYQTAVSQGNSWIAVSDDYGATWTDTFVLKNWICIGMSSNGQYQSIVSETYSGSGVQIYRSIDYGVTFNYVGTAADYVFIYVDPTGRYQTAVTRTGVIYNSATYGASWTSGGANTHQDISMSESEQIQAKILNGYVNVSVDYGVTWKQVGENFSSPSSFWKQVAVSGSGSFEDVSYQTSTIVSQVQVKALSFKENSKQGIGIRYYDNNGVNWPVQPLNKLDIPVNGNVSANTLGYHLNYIKYTISNLPPAGAVAWQMMYAPSNIINSFTIPVLMSKYQGIEPDITSDNAYTKIDINKALDRIQKDNISLNVFDVKKSDRILIKAYGVSNVYELANEMDLEVQYIDDDGKIVVQSLISTQEYPNFGTNYVYFIEFYRTQSELNPENQIYYEVGDVNLITGGYHMASTVSGSGVTKQDQTASVPAIGVINFGDTYRFYYQFTDVITPIIANVESRSASFLYPSKSIAVGRWGIADSKQIRKTEECLIYGNLLKQGDLNYNEINVFNSNPYYLDSRFGKITGIVQKGNTIQVYQESKITPISVNAIETTLPDGTTSMVYSDKVLGQARPLPYEIGCSHLGSMSNNLYSTYFYDFKTSSFYRFSQDGVKNILFDDSNPEQGAKMKAYGTYLTKLITSAINAGNTISIVSGYDPVKDMYLFSYMNNTLNTYITLGFHEPTNSWLSWYSLKYYGYFSMNSNRVFCVGPWINEMHVVTQPNVTTGYLTVHFNALPAQIKTFHNIEVGSEQVWVPSTSGDITVDENSVSYQNPNSREWQYGKMSSMLSEVSFKKVEGRLVATFLRNMLKRNGTMGTKTNLINGETLKGNVLNVKLRNLKSTVNTLKYIIIGYQKSK